MTQQSHSHLQLQQAGTSHPHAPCLHRTQLFTLNDVYFFGIYKFGITLSPNERLKLTRKCSIKRIKTDWHLTSPTAETSLYKTLQMSQLWQADRPIQWTWQVRQRNVQHSVQKLLEALKHLQYTNTTPITSEYVQQCTQVHSSWHECLVQTWANSSSVGYRLCGHTYMWFTVSSRPHSIKKR